MTARVSALAAIRSALVAAIGRALSAVVWCVLLALSGVGLLVAGAYVLAGLGWALVVGGAIATITSVLLVVGMSRATA